MAGTQTKDAPRLFVLNVPNQLSCARLLLAVVLFVAIDLAWYYWGAALFLLAAATDWLDGFYARRYSQVTQLGRILDPFADKLIVCGTFIYLASIEGSEVYAWMAVVVMGRELLVTALRSFIEERGGDFSANLAGKLKMVMQCLCIVSSLWLLASEGSAVGQSWTTLRWTTSILVWVAVAITVYSGVGYIAAAVRMFRSTAR